MYTQIFQLNSCNCYALDISSKCRLWHVTCALPQVSETVIYAIFKQFSDKTCTFCYKQYLPCHLLPNIFITVLTSQEVNNYLVVKGLTFLTNGTSISVWRPCTKYVQLNGNSGDLQWEILFSNLSYDWLHQQLYYSFH